MLVFTKADTEDTSYQLFMIYRPPYTVLLLNLKQSYWLAGSLRCSLYLYELNGQNRMKTNIRGIEMSATDWWSSILQMFTNDVSFNFRRFKGIMKSVNNSDVQ